MTSRVLPFGFPEARRADLARVPDRVLAKMTRADLVNRLAAAGEYKRRAHDPRADADQFRYRLGLATEVLTTDDPKRADELVKGAGPGVTLGTGRASVLSAPSRPVPSRRPSPPPRRVADMTMLVKSGGRTIRVDPARASKAAAVSYAASELAWQRSAAGQAMAKAAQYERKAQLATSPADRSGYLELARQEREMGRVG